MSYPTPIRMKDRIVLFLAIFAALARAPGNTDTVDGRRALVLRMLRRDDGAALPDVILNALSMELVEIGAQFSTFDALLTSYDAAITHATNIATGLDIALAGSVEASPIFASGATADGYPTKQSVV